KFAGGDPNADVGPIIASAPFFPVPEASLVSSSCGSLTNGAKFNREPIAGDPFVNLNAGGITPVVQPLPQDEQSVDFLYGGGGNGGDFLVGGSNDVRGFFGGMGGSVSLTAFHTRNLVAGTFDCAVEVEAATPDVVDLNGISVSGLGDPVIAADNPRSRIFGADIHSRTGSSFALDTSIGLFRTTPASVNDAGCLGGVEGQPKNAHCWPAGIVLGADTSGFFAIVNDKPHMTVDERSRGTGAGDVYVSWTAFNMNGVGNNTINLVACRNGFLTLA